MLRDVHHTAVNARAVSRSEILASYPGYYNNLFPLKENPGSPNPGKTERLVLASSGYLMAFDVDCSQIPEWSEPE